MITGFIAVGVVALVVFLIGSKDDKSEMKEIFGRLFKVLTSVIKRVFGFVGKLCSMIAQGVSKK